MLRTKVKRRVFAAAIAATSIVGFSISSMADGHKVLDSIHFLIPGGAGVAGMGQPAEQGRR